MPPRFGQPHTNSFACVWSYLVVPEHRDAFKKAYGPKGVWHEFFSNSPDYLSTDLLEDKNDPNRFVTIDTFKTSDARDKLVAARQTEFNEIDGTWEKATRNETFIGMFEVCAPDC